MSLGTLSGSWRQGGGGEAMSRQHALAVYRQDEHGELVGLRGCPVDHRQPVVCTYREVVGERHGSLSGVLPLRLERAGAIRDEDVGLAFGYQHFINRATRRGHRRIGAAGELQRLPLQRSERTGLELVALAEHLPGIVA